MLISRQSYRLLFIFVSLLLLDQRTVAQEQEIDKRLFPPELIMRHRSELQLSNEQLKAIREIVDEQSQKVAIAREATDRYRQKVAKLLELAEAEDSSVLKELQTYLTAERDMKLSHFTAMLRIRSVLTAGQRSQLMSKRKETRPGQVDGKAPPQPAHGTESALSRPPKEIGRLGITPELTAAELEKAVRNLHVDDVPWRKIDWETNLVRGLQRSRLERKPLVIWVFIDRPIDDERC